MTNIIITEIETLASKVESVFSPAAKVIVADAESAGTEALKFIETNGLQDLYQIAVTLLTSIAAGTPWGEVLTALVAQGTKDGITIAQGAESVVLATAQADLIAAGKLIPPVATPAPTPAA